MPLPGAADLAPAEEDDRSVAMVAGIDGWLRRRGAEPEASERRRSRFGSFEGDRTGNNGALREELREILGIVPSELAQAPRITADVDALAGEHDYNAAVGGGCTATAVRWPAFTVGGAGGATAHGEGLLLRPAATPPRARIIVLPDADHSPEWVSGCVAAAPDSDRYALRLAEAGCEVLVLALIDRADDFSGSDAAQSTVTATATATATFGALTTSKFGALRTNQPHREWLHRPAYEMGRTLIGYEVAKVLAAAEALSSGAPEPLPLGLFGYGEGGLLALHAAALSPRVDATVVSGYFEKRLALHDEPLYRNLFGFLSVLDDAELSWLIAPRALIVEHSEVATVSGPPPVRAGRAGAAPGVIGTPSDEAVAAEVARANAGLAWLGKDGSVELVAAEGGGTVPCAGCPATIGRLIDALGAASSAQAPVRSQDHHQLAPCRGRLLSPRCRQCSRLRRLRQAGCPSRRQCGARSRHGCSGR